MSLTYTQKQFVQKNYPSKSIEEIASELGVATHKVEKHIEKNTHLFQGKKYKQNETEESDLILFSFATVKSWFKANWINVLTLTVFVIFAYINAFTADFVSDDIQGIVELKDQIASPSYIFSNPTFFARSFLFFISYHVGGLTPFAFRFWNLLFHIANVWLIYILTPYFIRKQMVAFIAAAIFAVHPMMIESVTWISGGIYSQAALCIQLSLFFYLQAKRNHMIGYISGSIISFILALSVSEKVIIYPFILLFYEFSFGSLLKRWKYVIPYFGVSFMWGLLLIGRISGRVEYLQRTNGTKQAVQLYNPLVQIPVALAKYFQLYFWPFGNTLYHSEFKMDLEKYLTTLVITGTFLVLYFLAFKKNKKIFFFMSFFGISLLPTMNPFGLSWIVAERYAYLGSIGIFVIVAYFINKLIESKDYKSVGYILLTFIIIGLTVRTLWRNSEWKNVDTLWVATGKTSPSDPKTHNNLGDMYARHNDMNKAIEEFSAAIQLNPNYAAAWYNRGNTYKHMNQDDKALTDFQTAVEKDPTIWQGYMNIAVIQFSKGQLAEAEANLNKALQLNPNNPSLYANLGVVALTKGNKQEALNYLHKALQIDPQNAFALEWIKKAESVK
jgi:tetratricopeptide (TPR) repeat protein